MSATPGPLEGQDATRDDGSRTSPMQRATRIVMQVLWPAFLMAIAAEGVLFSLIDPRELRVVAEYLHDSRLAAYTVGFFVLWILFACSSAITYFLAHGVGEPPARDDG